MLNVKQYNEKLRSVCYLLNKNICKDILIIIYEYLDIVKESPYLRWYKNYVRTVVNREFMIVQKLNDMYNFKTRPKDYKYLCKNNYLTLFIFADFATKYRLCTEKISGKVYKRNREILYSHYIFNKTRLICKN